MKAAIFVASFLAAGCAGQQVQLGDADRRGLASQPVHAVHYPPARIFFVESSGYTTAAVLFSPLVVLAQTAESRSLASELELEDPVGRVKERLSAALESRTKVNRVASPPERSDPETLRKVLGSGLVLEVRTEKWGIDNNRAKYAAGVHLLRLSDGATLWQAVCNDSIADKDKPSPTLDELKADRGELLKAKLGQAADACAEQLAGWALGG